MVVGLAIALSVSWRAFREAPDRAFAVAALVVAGVEVLVLVGSVMLGFLYLSL
ncbi:MAG: hypothetical protein JXQ75_08200 [Phycisphaerae bacterium]|nr:hypothetical protein [Phycisphaerae bacterium]